MATEFYAKDRASWRDWLMKNQNREEGVWLVFDKQKDGIRLLKYDDICEEALCFGWIDSLPRKKSETQSMLYISPRKAKSNWSAINKIRAEKMIKDGKMMPSGFALIELAKKSGTWNALNPVDNLIVPPDLEDGLNKFSNATRNFSAFPASVKRGILEWILNAKKAETRAARIEKTAEMAERNLRVNQYVKKIEQ